MASVAKPMKRGDGRERRVARAASLYPDTYQRIRSVCVWAPPTFDLDDHAARITLTAKAGRT